MDRVINALRGKNPQLNGGKSSQEEEKSPSSGRKVNSKVLPNNKGVAPSGVGSPLKAKAANDFRPNKE